MLEWQEVRRRRGIAAFVTGMAALALLAAHSMQNQVQIDLAGLLQSGLPYLPWAG